MSSALGGPLITLAGALAAADNAALGDTRFLPLQQGNDVVEVYVDLTGAVGAGTTIRPVYAPNPNDLTQQYEAPDYDQQVIAPGSFSFEVPARPGCRVGFKVAALAAAGIVRIRARYGHSAQA